MSRATRAMIEIRPVPNGDPLEFEVTVREADSESRHLVAMSRADHVRLGGGHPPEDCIEAAFRFLLEREPKEAILARFDVMAISRYFPEFERDLPRYLKAK